jgi:hypothetical protein
VLPGKSCTHFGEHTALVFRVDDCDVEANKQILTTACDLFVILLGLLFDSENKRSAFFRNVRKLPDYMVAHHRKYYFFLSILSFCTSDFFLFVD